MLNKGETFDYLLCNKCGTLQLVSDIECIDQYYNNYPVFRKNADITTYNRLYLVLAKIMISRFVYPFRSIFNDDILWGGIPNCLIGTGVARNNKILDVGCGTGEWLQNLKKIGFTNLYAVDKFVPEKLVKNGIEFCKGEIFDIEWNNFDVITLHHSFEHMEHPKETLTKIYSILNENGFCIIRIPVMGGVAWKIYNIDWFQIDAPRHLYLYTEKSMKYMCQQIGFEIYDVRYDSTCSQFCISEYYKKTKKSFEQICRQSVDADVIKKYKKQARLANKRHQGDQAIFYLRKK
jgi:ubiquinone/menaquinone biosynthesis C-methylase UbiE